jgi:hypothetical protein
MSTRKIGTLNLQKPAAIMHQYMKQTKYTMASSTWAEIASYNGKERRELCMKRTLIFLGADSLFRDVSACTLFVGGMVWYGVTTTCLAHTVPNQSMPSS